MFNNFECMGASMESEETNRVCATESVKDLQASLFPISHQFPRLLYSPSSFLGNFLLKSNQLEISEDRPGTASIPRLREPRDLFALSREVPCPAQVARWPTECQVLDERVEHINYNPPTPEPYYAPTGKEVQPKPLGEEYGIVVYQYYPVSAINYDEQTGAMVKCTTSFGESTFNRSCVGGSKYLSTTPVELEEDDLRFESRFESGNLAKAIKLTANFYELYLRTDLYTNRHTQWFYFRVTNVKRHVLYRFSIVNLSKGDSLYNSGMKPLMYSTKDAKLHSIGWRRCGDNIVYYCNENGNPDEDQPPTYTLTFTLEFPHDKDIVYLAHSYPFTYTDMQDYLTAMSSHPIKSTYSTLRLLCRSLAGNNVYYVTITNPNTPSDKKKKAVVITARVHPGETPSSWMMKGFLDFLTGDSGPARELRDKFIFKIVPMINPDGVIVGNSRCSLTGRDLNRQYRTVIRETYPPIWHIKLMVRRLIEECGVAMYCDLHAHSRQNNIFIYGCENRRGVERYLHEQVFPLMLHKNAADKFSFESCKFRVQRCKEGAGRVVMWMMGIGNSYTMEASFAGSDLGPRADTHFNTLDYEMMGRSFCQTLLDFYDDDPGKEKLRCKIIKRLLKEGSTADEPTNITLSDYSSDGGDSSSSEEGGGREHYGIPLVVPPSSPILPSSKSKKKRPVPTLTKQAITVKSPTLQRKTLPLYQATLGLSLMDDCGSTSADSNSDYESSPSILERSRMKQRKMHRKSKKNPKVKVGEHSDTEVQIQKHNRKSLTVLELLPAEKMRSQSWNRCAGFPQSRTISHLDGRTTHHSTAKQLAEVQAKLLSLKHRLWTGINDGENYNIPLSWGYVNYPIRRSSAPNKKKSEKNHHTKKSAEKPVVEKPPKLEKRKSKRNKDDIKKSPKKKQNGIKRQTAVDDWSGLYDSPPTCYSKSFADFGKRKGKSMDLPRAESYVDVDKKKKGKKKKKQKIKWEKEVTNIVNVKAFIDKSKDKGGK